MLLISTITGASLFMITLDFGKDKKGQNETVLIDTVMVLYVRIVEC